VGEVEWWLPGDAEPYVPGSVRVACEADWLPIRVPAPSMAMHPSASRLPAPCSPPWMSYCLTDLT